MELDVPAILCHPDGEKSCGACCGMYNLRGMTAETTLDRLAERTEAFHGEARVDDPDNLRAFRARWETVDPDAKLLSDLPNCPFLGLLDLDRTPEDSRVGCLVHPLQNDGVDGRECGVYDQKTCESYLCAAHSVLRREEKWLVIHASTSSYTYGLVLTDPRFVRELFERVADLNGASIRADRLAGALDAASAYFRLKVEWPYRADDGIFGQLQAGEGLDTPRRPPAHDVLGLPKTPWDTILNCLGTSVETPAGLSHARRLVAERVQAVADAVQP